MAVAKKCEVREFVSKSDSEKPSEQQTVFLIKSLTIFDKLSLAELEYDTKTIQGAANFNLALIAKLLCGWKNFKYADGSDAPFNASDAASNISKIPDNVVFEMAAFIENNEAANAKTAGE